MKRYRLAHLPDTQVGHFLKEIIPGEYISQGGIGFKGPGDRSHTNDGPAGSDLHVHHDDREVFIILAGKGNMEINGTQHPVTTGDVIVVEPGEDHHLIADQEDPCINLWLHAGPERNERQVRSMTQGNR